MWQHLDKITQYSKKILPIYWAFLTYMLLKSGEEKKEYWFAFQGIDKIVHVGIFVVLGVLFRAAFPKINVFLFFFILFLYSLFTEILQHIMQMGRTGDVMDLIANMFGAFVGCIIFEKGCRK